MTEPVAASGPADAVRRAPFGTNPSVGARGQRTRQRILDAALRVFADVGLHQGSVERIAEEAGCSRASFYQYFADKDALLRELAGRVALQIDAAIGWLEPVTPGADGWASLRDLVERWAAIHERHRPVFAAFPVMFEADPEFASDTTATRARFTNAIATRIDHSDLSPPTVAGAADLLLVMLGRTLADLAALRQLAPESYPADASFDAVTDVAHRVLFGLDIDVNVHRHDLPAPPLLEFGPLVRSGMEKGSRSRGDASTRAALLAAARTSFLAHGYHGTRIDTIADEAGVSHGTLYTYFDSKDHVAQVLAMRAMRDSAETLQRMPDLRDRDAGRVALRRWLGEYNRAQAGETAMIQVWADALRQTGDPIAESAPALDWGRRQILNHMAHRDFGDVEIEAAVLLSLLSMLGSRERSTTTLDTAALFIDRGFFGGHAAD